MNYSDYRFSLDINESVSAVCPRVKKGDTVRRLIITLTQNGRPYLPGDGCSAVFRGEKPDGAVLFNECTVNNGSLTVPITSQTIAVPGKVKCEISLYSEAGDLLTSPTFDIAVDDTVSDDAAIESTNEYTALARMIGEVGSIDLAVKDALDRAMEEENFVSPTVSVTQTADGYTVTVTDKNGKQQFEVKNGEAGRDGTDGKNGTDGKDGVSLEHSWNGTVLTVTSASGTDSTDLKGEKGEKGEKGDKGDPGEAGTEGKAGVDGIDGKDGTSVTVTSVSESAADGGSNIVTFSDGKTLTVKNGSKGSKGDTGEQGEQGAQGIQGIQGDKGDPGEKGADGKSAYSYAVDAGYTGTEEEFAAKLASSNTSNGDGGSVTVSGALFVTLNTDTMTVSSDSLSAMESAHADGRPIYLVHDLIRSGDNTVLPFVHRTNMSSGTVLWVFSAIVHQGTESATPNLDVIRVYGDTGGARRMVYEEITLKSDIPTGGEIGGSNVSTPDWNQNDETASDYIKNRPFYEGLSDLLPETEITLEDGMYNGEYSGNDLVIGNTYTVTWNGTEYECVAISAGGGMGVIGNTAAIDGEDTGEPFAIMLSGQNGMWAALSLTGEASATVKITSNIIKKIDEKFLPALSVIAYIPIYVEPGPVYSTTVTVGELSKMISDGKMVIAKIYNTNVDPINIHYYPLWYHDLIDSTSAGHPIDLVSTAWFAFDDDRYMRLSWPADPDFTNLPNEVYAVLGKM